MGLTLAQVRQNVSTRLDGITGWDPSPMPYDVFRRAPANDLTATFAVGIPSTAALTDRQRAGQDVYVRSDVRVAYAQRIQPKAKTASYDAAQAAGLALVDRLLTNDGANSWPGQLSIAFRDMQGAILDGGEWFVGDLGFDVSFHLTTA